jgi:hypothetical protein
MDSHRAIGSPNPQLGMLCALSGYQKRAKLGGSAYKLISKWMSAAQ